MLVLSGESRWVRRGPLTEMGKAGGGAEHVWRWSQEFCFRLMRLEMCVRCSSGDGWAIWMNKRVQLIVYH